MKNLFTVLAIIALSSIGVYFVACDKVEIKPSTQTEGFKSSERRVQYRAGRRAQRTALLATTYAYSPDPSTPYAGWVAATGTPTITGCQSALVSVDAGQTFIAYADIANADSLYFTFVDNSGTPIFSWVEKWINITGLHLDLQSHDPYGSSTMTMDSLLTLAGVSTNPIQGTFEITPFGNGQTGNTFVTPSYIFNR